jgi:maltose O-acetyltransferase
MSSEKERMLRGEPYLTNDPELLLDRKNCVLLCERFNATSFGETVARRAILDELLGDLGEEADVIAPFHCDYGYHITVGARTFINYGAVILDGAAVGIGDDVQIGPSVKLLTPTHALDHDARRRGVENVAPVTIGDGAWLATGVIVCPGVTIGENTVVGAGSVVTKDLPAGHLCLGNPCRVIREI